jgi:hypothetical protein
MESAWIETAAVVTLIVILTVRRWMRLVKWMLVPIAIWILIRALDRARKRSYP